MVCSHVFVYIILYIYKWLLYEFICIANTHAHTLAPCAMCMRKSSVCVTSCVWIWCGGSDRPNHAYKRRKIKQQQPRLKTKHTIQCYANTQMLHAVDLGSLFVCRTDCAWCSVYSIFFSSQSNLAVVAECRCRWCFFSFFCFFLNVKFMRLTG